MSSTVFFLDLTYGQQGAVHTLDACRALTDRDWNLEAVFTDQEGASVARHLASLDPRVTAVSGGTGPGAADWPRVVDRAEGESVGFLLPGDRLDPTALSTLTGALRDSVARWALGMWEGAPYADWWAQPDLSASAAALLLAGAAFPHAAALAGRTAWLEAAARRPETAADPSRAGAWLALALDGPPRVVPHTVCAVAARPLQVGPDAVGPWAERFAGEDPKGLARVVADLGRICAGMRVAHEAVLDQLRFTRTWIAGQALSAGTPASTSLLDALLRRGDRRVWIWGAGTAGRRVLAWLRNRKVPVTGFLDGNADRTGARLDDLPVHHGPSFVSEPRAVGDEPPLILIASMYGDEIASALRVAGLREGDDFVQVWLGALVQDGGTRA